MAENKDEAIDSGMPGLALRIAEKVNNLKYIILAVIVALIIVLAVFSYQRRQTAAREAAAEAAVYQDEINLATKPESAGSDVFAKAAKEYAGLPAGARAAVLAFSLAYNKGDNAAAEQAMRDFVRAYPENFLASRAKLAMGQALLAQDKNAEAESIFRELAATPGSEVFPEAKLALAQTLEKQAEAVKDNQDEYRRRLEAAEAEYNDIMVRSQISIPAQRGFWPQVVLMQADFARTVIRDRLAGYQHPEPAGASFGALQQQQQATGESVAAPADVEEAPAAPEAEPAPAAPVDEAAAPEAAK